MRKAIYLVGLFFVVSALFAAEPPTADPAANGTWILNVAKSKYNPGPAPRSATRTYEVSGDTVKYTNNVINAAGNPEISGYTARYDGKDHPITGVATSDTISLKRIDPYTVESVQKKAGKVVVETRRVISKDGKTMTVTSKGTNSKGETTNNVQVFEKQ